MRILVKMKQIKYNYDFSRYNLIVFCAEIIIMNNLARRTFSHFFHVCGLMSLVMGPFYLMEEPRSPYPPLYLHPRSHSLHL